MAHALESSRAGSLAAGAGAVSVIIGKPIMPTGSDWKNAVKLRDEVRSEILRHCGEPDLASVYTSISQMEIERPDTPRTEE